MILYFTGTGNSEYVATGIGRETGDETVNLFEKIKNRDFSDMHSDRPWVIAAPTYAWRIPHILDEWLEKTNLFGSKEIYFVMTCGGGIGNAGKYLSKLCERKNMDYFGCYPIIMPENYIAMFPTPSEEDALNTIRGSETEIDNIGRIIKSGQRFHKNPITVKDKIDSSVVNDIFYPVFVHAKKFYATESCISCGKCATVCPLNNVQIDSGRPVWGKDCTHCMACICRCPVEAIEYGKQSKGMRRYLCPESKI